MVGNNVVEFTNVYVSTLLFIVWMNNFKGPFSSVYSNTFSLYFII